MVRAQGGGGGRAGKRELRCYSGVERERQMCGKWSSNYDR